MLRSEKKRGLDTRVSRSSFSPCLPRGPSHSSPPHPHPAPTGAGSFDGRFGPASRLALGAEGGASGFDPGETPGRQGQGLEASERRVEPEPGDL